MPIATCAEEFFDCGYELGIKVPGEGMAWVVDQNAREHDCIVLCGVWGSGRIGEVFANAQGCFLRGIGARFGEFDNFGEVNEFGSLLFVLLVVARGIFVVDTYSVA